MSVITWQLLAVLVAVALLGILIGLSAMHLRHIRKQKDEYNSNRAVVEQLTAERDQVKAEKTDIVQAFESEQKQAKITRRKHAQLAAQQETLQVHAGLQSRRLEIVTAELHASEEKCIRLQRDFASFKANKLREVRMLKVSGDEWLDNEELPVLNKIVDADSEQRTDLEAFDGDDLQTDLDQTQPIIASELDIPSLAESELPNSVDELEFELETFDQPN